MTAIETTSPLQNKFDSVKVFSATMVAQRAELGDVVSAWISANPQHSISNIVVTQSSDASFHCIAISVFYVNGVDR